MSVVGIFGEQRGSGKTAAACFLLGLAELSDRRPIALDASESEDLKRVVGRWNERRDAAAQIIITNGDVAAWLAANSVAKGTELAVVDGVALDAENAANVIRHVDHIILLHKALDPLSTLARSVWSIAERLDAAATTIPTVSVLVMGKAGRRHAADLTTARAATAFPLKVAETPVPFETRLVGAIERGDFELGDPGASPALRAHVECWMELNHGGA